MKILLKIRYIGTHYCGYQVQPNGVTVQQRLNEAALAVFGYDCDVVGCSRTDSGVHANLFCATVAKKGTNCLETEIPVERIPHALSAHLPTDIAVFDAQWVGADFHARYDVREKEYLYRFYTGRIRDPFEEERSYHLPALAGEEAFLRMNEAAKTLCGKQDFAAYMAQGSKVVETVRTIYRSEMLREGDILIYRVSADGFLYNMVRILAGTLAAVGQGRLSPDDVRRITEKRDRSLAGATAPACGLYLNRVIYPHDLT
ncbi:MAG: tRNA pseudouridine(38-40) synthase TruA [Clostridia bacterium]|nr:tRNA pseudouridine(38-40) synthase TruA [Clostridia bacterium]